MARLDFFVCFLDAWAMQVTAKKRGPIYEAVLPDPRASFRFFESKGTHFPFRFHQHPEMELTLILKGRGLRYVGETVEAFGPGDLCLLGPGLPHTWCSEGGGGPSHSLVAQWRPDLFRDFLELEEWGAVRRLLGQCVRGLHVDGPGAFGVAESFRALLGVPAASPRRLTGLLEILLQITETARGRELCLTGPAGDSPKPVGEVLAFLHEHSGDNIEQAVVANRMGLTPSAFSRWFRRQVGRPWVDYLQDLRVARACRALSETEAPVLTIATEAGFQNLSHFHKVFKKSRGLTPLAYRKQFFAP